MNIQIKRAEPSDFLLVAPLFNEYRIFYGQHPDLPLAEQFIKDRLDHKESVIFLATAEQNGELSSLGFTQLYPQFSSVRMLKTWVLNDLYVEKGHRKTGIGRLLLKAALRFAKEEGVSSMQLETAPDNINAQKLYESMGFIRQAASAVYFNYHINPLQLPEDA